MRVNTPYPYLGSLQGVLQRAFIFLENQGNNRTFARKIVPPQRTVHTWLLNRGSQRVDGVLVPLSVRDSQYAWADNVGRLRSRIGGIGGEFWWSLHHEGLKGVNVGQEYSGQKKLTKDC